MNFDEICKKIKKLEIQGAENIALAGLKAYSLKPNKNSIKRLESLRPTEPALFNALRYAEKYSVKEARSHFNQAGKKIIQYGYKKIHGIIFTHCHSSTVIAILKYAKKKRKKFEVFNTETRPLYQGRKTAKELSRAGIKVTTIPDLAAGDALTRNGALKKSSLMLIGADAILKNGDVVNKVGSGMFVETAHYNKIPVYVASDSWKFSLRPIKLEERSFKEVWKKAPEHIKIKNPAFDIVRARDITAIISELGILKPKQFVNKVKNQKIFKS